MYSDAAKIIWNKSDVTTSLSLADQAECGSYTYTLTATATGSALDAATFSTDFDLYNKVLSIRSTDLLWWVSYWVNPYTLNPGSFFLDFTVSYTDYPTISVTRTIEIEFYLCILAQDI